MSGIEAVGLVLGVLPLVVEGLEKYSTAVSTTEKFLHCGRELRNLRRRLNAENEIFRNTCELLLRNITNETDTSILIADPTGEPWKNSELEERLKKALGSSYKTCCETMKDMHYTIDDLRKHLHLRPAEVGALVSQQPVSALDEFADLFCRARNWLLDCVHFKRSSSALIERSMRKAYKESETTTAPSGSSPSNQCCWSRSDPRRGASL